MIYDSFTITVLTILENLGFAKKGEGGAYVAGGRLRFDRSGAPALNTDGGGLSSNHPGMRGIFLLIEAARQLRGESTSSGARGAARRRARQRRPTGYPARGRHDHPRKGVRGHALQRGTEPQRPLPDLSEPDTARSGRPPSSTG